MDRISLPGQSLLGSVSVDRLNRCARGRPARLVAGRQPEGVHSVHLIVAARVKSAPFVVVAGMCRIPDSRPLRLVKKWLHGGGGGSGGAAATSTISSARSRPSAGDVGIVRNRALTRSCGWKSTSTEERSSGPRRRSSSPRDERLCLPTATAAAFCWRRRRTKRDIDDELQQTLALVHRCQPLCVASTLNDNEVKKDYSVVWICRRFDHRPLRLRHYEMNQILNCSSEFHPRFLASRPTPN